MKKKEVRLKNIRTGVERPGPSQEVETRAGMSTYSKFGVFSVCSVIYY